MTIEQIDEMIAILRELRTITLKSEAASRARAALPAGSTRARVTTANARWSIAAGARRLTMRRLFSAVASVPELRYMYLGRESTGAL